MRAGESIGPYGNEVLMAGTTRDSDDQARERDPDGSASERGARVEYLPPTLLGVLAGSLPTGPWRVVVAGGLVVVVGLGLWTGALLWPSLAAIGASAIVAVGTAEGIEPGERRWVRIASVFSLVAMILGLAALASSRIGHVSAAADGQTAAGSGESSGAAEVEGNWRQDRRGVEPTSAASLEGEEGVAELTGVGNGVPEPSYTGMMRIIGDHRSSLSGSGSADASIWCATEGAVRTGDGFCAASPARCMQFVRQFSLWQTAMGAEEEAGNWVPSGYARDYRGCFGVATGVGASALELMCRCDERRDLINESNRLEVLCLSGDTQN